MKPEDTLRGITKNLADVYEVVADDDWELYEAVEIAFETIDSALQTKSENGEG